MRRWSDPVDFPLPLFHPKYNWSLAAVEAHIGSATHDVVAQCGAGWRSAQVTPLQYLYENVVSFVGSEMV